jgi:hypothetical protein
MTVEGDGFDIARADGAAVPHREVVSRYRGWLQSTNGVRRPQADAAMFRCS